MAIRITDLKGLSPEGYKPLNKKQQATIKRRIKALLKKMSVKAKVQ